MTTEQSKILVVDDEDVVRESFRELLSMQGYGVTVAGNGIEGLEQLEKGSFDLVIVDINMPKLDGIDFCREAVKKSPRLKDKFLFITGDLYGEMEALSMFIKSGTKVMKKPLSKTELLENVRAVLNNPRPG
ncbi:MAG: response regulator [Deltaproteobacteria bacterium]|nr:response regulator [Deltaproteobacteria bacterium]